MKYLRIALFAALSLVAATSTAADQAAAAAAAFNGAQNSAFTNVPSDLAKLQGGGTPNLLETPPDSDLMLQMLDTAYGGPIKSVKERFFGQGGKDFQDHTDNLTIICLAASIMTAIAYIIGGVLLIYISLGSILHTAQSGEFLGKRWNGVFVPARVGMAMAAAFPIKALAGMCLAQAVILAIVMLGSNAGTAVWKNLSTYLITQPIVKYKATSAAFVPSLVYMHTCTQTLASMGETVSGKPGDLVEINKTGLHAGPSITYDFGPNRVCGSMKLSKPWDDIVFGGLQNAGEAVFTLDSDLHGRQQFQTAIQKGIYNLQAKYIVGDYQDSAKSIAKEIVAIDPDVWNEMDADKKGVFANKVARVADSFNVEVSDLVSRSAKAELATRNAELSQSIAIGGWAMAGSYYNVIQRQQKSIFDSAQQATSVEYEAPRKYSLPTGFFGCLLDKIYRAWSAENLSCDQAARVGNSQARITNVLLTASELSASPEFRIAAREQTNRNIATEIFQQVTNPYQTAQDYLAEDNSDPIDKLITTGDIIVNTTIGLMAADKLIATGVVVVAPEVAVAQAATSSSGGVLGSFITDMLPKLLIVGFIMNTVIPNMPYFLWTLALAGYLIYTIEAVLAAPLWAVFHAHPDGHDVAGNAARGYPIIISLVLRPTLMVIGLLVGMAVVRIMGWVIDQTIFKAWSSYSSTHIFNAMSFIGLIGIYFMLIMAICYKSFSMINDLPNAILGWVGANDGRDLGDTHQSKGVILAQLPQVAGGALGALQKPPPKQASTKDLAALVAKSK